MKRSLIAIGVLTLILFAACATTPSTAAPSVQGTVTSATSNSVTIKTATGDTSTVNFGSGTQMSWFTGVPAQAAEIQAGHRISVWLNNGSQTASKIVLGQ